MEPDQGPERTGCWAGGQNWGRIGTCGQNWDVSHGGGVCIWLGDGGGAGRVVESGEQLYPGESGQCRLGLQLQPSP